MNDKKPTRNQDGTDKRVDGVRPPSKPIKGTPDDIALACIVFVVGVVGVYALIGFLIWVGVWPDRGAL